MQPPSTLAGADPAAGPAQEMPKTVDFAWGVKIRNLSKQGTL